MATISVSPATTTGPSVADQILGWDHLEWWVGNARAVTAWLCGGFGFEVVAYCGPRRDSPTKLATYWARATSASSSPPVSRPSRRSPATSSSMEMVSATWRGRWPTR